MKFYSILLSILLSIISISAQDIITTADGTSIEARVVEVSPYEIKYYPANSPDGPLYSIPTEYLSRILYHNGNVDYFNEQENLRVLSTSMSDNERNRIHELIRNGVTADQLKTKAHRLRVVGWVGAGIFFVGGLTVSAILEHNHKDEVHGSSYIDQDNYNALHYYLPGIGVGTVLAGGWALGFNLYANKLLERAKLIEFLTTPIFQNNVLTMGDTSLSAGIDMFTHVPTHSHGMGLSLTLNF